MTPPPTKNTFCAIKAQTGDWKIHFPLRVVRYIFWRKTCTHTQTPTARARVSLLNQITGTFGAYAERETPQRRRRDHRSISFSYQDATRSDCETVRQNGETRGLKTLTAAAAEALECICLRQRLVVVGGNGGGGVAKNDQPTSRRGELANERENSRAAKSERVNFPRCPCGHPPSTIPGSHRTIKSHFPQRERETFTHCGRSGEAGVDNETSQMMNQQKNI